MKIIKWAAVVITALFALMNLGTAQESIDQTWVRVVGPVLGIIGFVAAFGLAAALSWGRSAVIGVGALNMAVAIIGLIAGTEGAVVGLVVGAICVGLGALATGESRPAVEA